MVLNNSKVGCRINDTAVNHLMYADDICLIASSPAALQNLLNICSDFAHVNSVVFNEGKTKLMCYKPKALANLRIPDIFVNGKSISVVNEHKYLGILLQDNQSDESDMKRQVKAIYSRGNMLASRFKNCSVDVKNCLFRAYCSNAYGSQLWANFRKPMFQKVKVAYNDVYRRLFNIHRGESISAAFVSNHVDSFCTVLRKLVFSFKSRLNVSANQLIKSIIGVPSFNTCSINNEWNKILYL